MSLGFIVSLLTLVVSTVHAALSSCVCSVRCFCRDVLVQCRLLNSLISLSFMLWVIFCTLPSVWNRYVHPACCVCHPVSMCPLHSRCCRWLAVCVSQCVLHVASGSVACCVVAVDQQSLLHVFTSSAALCLRPSVTVYCSYSLSTNT